MNYKCRMQWSTLTICQSVYCYNDSYQRQTVGVMVTSFYCLLSKITRLKKCIKSTLVWTPGISVTMIERAIWKSAYGVMNKHTKFGYNDQLWNVKLCLQAFSVVYWDAVISFVHGSLSCGHKLSLQYSKNLWIVYSSEKSSKSQPLEIFLYYLHKHYTNVHSLYSHIIS